MTDDAEWKSKIQAAIASQDETQVRALLTEYGVSYIFVGSKEREKYEDSLNNALLQSLGEIVFMDEDSGTYIVKVD